MNNIDSVSVSESSTCELDDCTPINFSPNQSLKILNQNIRSITKNMPGFHTVLARTNVQWDIITLTECWLPNTQVIPNIQGYSSFKTINNLTQNEGVCP